MKKKCLFLLCLSLSVCFAQTKQDMSVVDLTSVQPTKALVLGGSVLVEPVKTEFGYLTVVEGKILYTFDNDGNVLWNHGISSKPEMLSMGKCGMLYAVSRKKELSMINPSGKELWKKNVGFNISEKPFAGRDGRVFVRGKNEIACYGLKGTRRWSINVQDQDTSIPLVELNDGRLLVFSTKIVDSKSTGITISPYGEIMEELTFSGNVRNAISCSDGVLLSFSDGSIGLCAVQDEKTISKWAKTSKETGLTSQSLVKVFEGNTAVFISGSPAHFLYVNTKNGEIESRGKSGINTSSLTFFDITSLGLVLMNTTSGECYEKDGSLAWRTVFNAKDCSYSFVTDSGYIIFCGKDWVISTYRIRQGIGSKTSSYKDDPAVPYYSFYKKRTGETIGSYISSEYATEILNDWNKGDFGKREKNYIDEINLELSAINLKYTTKQINQQESSTKYLNEEPLYCKDIFSLAGNTGLCTFASTIAYMLARCEDPSLTYYLIKTAGEIGFDNDSELLQALEQVVIKTKPTSQDNIFISICDSTYEICKFMGKPAFFAKGNNVITYLLSPKYSTKVRKYAKATLDKIIDLKL